MKPSRVPSATYRIQLRGTVGFVAARALVPYLDALGASDLYASPILRARTGSTHGYDVVDPTSLDPALGTERELEALSAALHEKRMGLLLDIVPNHAAVGPENPWWMDVLENGPSAEHAGFFDIDWRSPANGLARIVLPVLGRPYGEALEAGEIRISLEDGGACATYFDHRFPLDPSTLEPILRVSQGVSPRARAALAALLRRVRRLPPRESRRRSAARRSAREELRADLDRLRATEPDIRRHLESNVRRLNSAENRDELDALLSEQVWRLAYWRTGTRKISYRRFFDVNDLAGVRVEDPRVFAATHDLTLRLVARGIVTGLRVDHVDGLADPEGYLRRLRTAARAVAGRDIFLVVEKILMGHERLRESWAADGTTGYDFAKVANGIFADEHGVRGLDRFYERFTGIRVRFEDLVRRLKKRVLVDLFPAELSRLRRQLLRLAERDRHACDLEDAAIGEALVAVTASLPVYRTYVRHGKTTPQDGLWLERALDEARRAEPGLRPAVDFLGRVLLGTPEESRREARERIPFVTSWQQLTGPVMAKGLEDTALYVYNRLVSLNVIGARTSRARSVNELHALNARRVGTGSLNATSTHDTKRSEDVQARINVLSEIGPEWAQRVARWSRWHRSETRVVHGVRVPDPNEQLLVYQTLVGAWPPGGPSRDFEKRVADYLVKAAREAKTHTSWTDPDEEHEKALVAWVGRILTPSPRSRFLEEIGALVEVASWFGALGSLAQVVLKVASPGIPDFYQGTELWDLSLVDPDNRRPVDWRRRASHLAELDRAEARDRRGLLQGLLSRWRDGRVKLYVASRALRARRSEQALFQDGAYVPLAVSDPVRHSVCAFARFQGDRSAIAIVPRLLARLLPTGVPPIAERPWGKSSISLPERAPVRYRDVFTAREVVASRGGIALADAFAELPVALLLGTGER